MVAKEIITIAIATIGFIGTVASTIFTFFKLRNARKQIKAAKTEEEKAAAEAALAQANNDMQDKLSSLVNDTEVLWKPYDALLKNAGLKSGPLKKDSVMNKLQAYATEKGYIFDSELWSKKNDETVNLTKNVNAK